MNQDNHDKKISSSEEIYVKDVVNKIKKTAAYITSKWVVILIAAIIGAVLGLGYSFYKKPTYTAICTFVLEDEKGGGGLSQYAGLASLAGINLGEGGGGGIFQGDNILELYTSRTMIEKALLTLCSFEGKSELLIDRYINSNKLRSKFLEGNKVGSINFSGNPDNFSRKQDSIVTAVVDMINKSVLQVTKPDKKLNIIEVEVVTNDEMFSKCFTENLVQTVNKFYILTKTKKETLNVAILQHQVDSVKNILNYSIKGVASANDAAPNANPNMSMLRVASQKRQIDVQANSAIYSEMVKNLELGKISLRQEMPLIQVIDKPVLPLLKKNITELKGIIIGFIIGGFLVVLSLILKKTITILN